MRREGIDGPRIGTRYFHPEPNMNYQFNRIMSVCGADPETLAEVAVKAAGIDDWLREFTALADTARGGGKEPELAAWLRAALFFLDAADPRRLAVYREYRETAMAVHADDFASGRITELRVPYGNAFLPVWHAVPADGSPEAPKVLFHLGYDSVKEEMLPILKMLAVRGLEVWLFEGPGQGEPLYEHGMAMTPEWEKPVGAVLDFLGIQDLSIIGLSLGGYLAPRAASRDGRIKRVVAWGVLWDFYETVVTRRGKALSRFIGACRSLGARSLLNLVVRKKMAKDSYVRWGVGHGMSVMGAKDPWEYFAALPRYSMKAISSMIEQDFLLLAGAEDHFIPAEHFAAQVDALRKVRSLTARLFTRAENAENHVQFGNIPLAVDVISGWIHERSGK